MVKLQLAMDTLDGDEALRLTECTAPFVDILEAGTPLIKSVGIGIVRKLKSIHPEKLVLADLKSSDVGAYEANMAFTAGADIVTTQGITTFATICEVQREADKWKRRAEVDMTGVKDPVGRTKEVREAGVSLVLYYRSIDQELTEGALWDEKAVNIVREMCKLGLDVAIAGGIHYDILPLLKDLPIYGIVVGRGITAQPNPAQVAEKFAQRIRQIWPD
jgi:3-hexulose-6-phosphate synthase